MSRKAIWLGMIIGSTIGGCVPGLWHAGLFSIWSIVLSTVGGLAGIWVAYRMDR
jgi:hypothetical protein